MDRDELSAWLRLLHTPKVGRDAARRLLTAFGSPQAVFDAPPKQLSHCVTPSQVAALGQVPKDADERLARTWAWAVEAQPDQHHLLALGDSRYPQALLETADPPLLLFAQGDLQWLNKTSLAVVGSRNPTPQGEQNARAFSANLSQAGLSVVSGLARGIDGAAHEGALTGPGATIAVVGTGLDTVYPTAHGPLACRIQNHGLLLSEYAPGTPPLAGHFPQRNRIIAGLAKGTLVVEAALQSGSLITARLALECGREVFAIPGSIHSPQSRGCHALIKQGAKLVETAEDILEELQLPLAPQHINNPRSELHDDVHLLLRLMGYDPITVDSLSNFSGMGAAELSAQLLDLELQGRVARLPGQRFQRVQRA